jgi:hypothetical protein
MITMRKGEIAATNTPHLTREEMENEYQRARESFEQALIQKTETDSIYVAAANRLNNIERLVHKVEQREAHARRAAAKSLYRIA